MRNLLKFGMIAFTMALVFAGAETANAQSREKVRDARREYREDIRDAREDYNRRVRQGNYEKAQREWREDSRDARREYRERTDNRNRSRWVNGRGRYNGRGYYNRGYVRSGRIYRNW